MTTIEDLEARIRVLEDIEAIKELKAKYWRCVDRKLWDEIVDCFTEDAVAEYGSGTGKLQGKKAIVQFLKENLVQGTITFHQGPNLEIEINSETAARGIWRMHDQVLGLREDAMDKPEARIDTELKGWGFYEDGYVKEKGNWKIRSTKVTRIFTERWKREGPEV